MRKSRVNNVQRFEQNCNFSLDDTINKYIYIIPVLRHACENNQH